jgi:catechol 2,3-dioxygenase-like lactoylglutathione lyase family enzyme
MIESVKVESVSVPVGDQDRAREFYVDTLGFELLVDSAWREGMRWSEVAPENSATSLMLVTWSSCMLPGMYRVIVLSTDDVETVHEELLSRGVAFELPPTETPRGKQAMFRDPDGNAFLLWEHTKGGPGMPHANRRHSDSRDARFREV